MKANKIFTSAAKQIIWKIIICELLLFFSASYSQNTGGQRVSDKNEAVNTFQFSSFVVNCLEGKAYIKWEVVESSDNCVYVLERSTDSRHYQPIFVKQSSMSPGNISLLHCYTDEHPADGISYYRVRRLSKQEINTSQTVGIVNNSSGSPAEYMSLGFNQ